ncbi:MAG: TIGR00153 family protein [Anaerohalosphaeraceae bacterium]|nr:TIGR00153 family protein [Anaerohalosphaeraceae bacterium]
MFFVNKQKKIETQIAQYNRQVANCMDVFRQALQQYCDNFDREAIKASFEKVHKAESLADDIRQDIEVVMYSKALFPESRGDILNLLETMDKVPNQAEAVVHMIWNQYISIPKEFHSEIIQLVDICCRCIDAMLEAAGKLFTNFTNATVAVGKIDELESEADRIEASLIEKIFSTQPDSIDKLLLRDLVKNIAGISDRAENAGDRIRIIIAKRSV